jgi:Gpi18-like mannosyltransferase
VGGAASPLNGIARWDSAYYLNIGSEGYTIAQSYVFRPLFPAIIWVLSSVGSSGVGWVSETIFGFVWNLLATFVAFYLLYRLTTMLFPGTTVPKKVATLLAFYPSSFFLTVIYPEATALLLITAAILLLETHHVASAAACGFLVGLTRPEGFLLFIPFMIKGIESKSRKLIAGSVAVLASLPVFLFYAFVRTGNLLLPIIMEQQWVKSTLVDVLSGNSGFTMVSPQVNNLTILLNITTLTIAAGFMIHASRRHRITDRIRPYYLWAWCLLILVFLLGEVHSWARFTLVLFPITWSEASTLEHSRRFWILVSIYTAMLVADAFLFTNWYPML